MICPLCQTDRPDGGEPCPCPPSVLERAKHAIAALAHLLSDYQMPTRDRGRRLVPPDRRTTDPASAPFTDLADAPEWISTYRLSQHWGCHQNLVLYYWRKNRLVGKKDGRRVLIAKASAIALDTKMRRWQHTRPSRPPAA